MCISIEALEKQILANGGTLTLIAGNHDKEFSEFFGSQEQSSAALDFCKTAPDPKKMIQLGKGLLELREFGSKKLAAMNFKNPEIWKILPEERLAILENMRRDERGKIILDTRCRMKLADIIDDNLFFHTPPQEQIVAALIAGTQEDSLERYVEKINFYYQESVWDVLWGDFSTFRGYEALTYPFLDENTRHNFLNSNAGRAIPESARYIRELGINSIIHGHEAQKRLPSETYERLAIVNTDNSAFYVHPFHDPRRSVASIATDGTITLYEGRTVMREH